MYSGLLMNAVYMYSEIYVRIHCSFIMRMYLYHACCMYMQCIYMHSVGDVELIQ